MIGALVAGITGSGGASLSSYESIATTTLGSNQTTVTFSSLGTDYKHIQFRILGRSANVGATRGNIRVQLNGDTGANYAWHILAGLGNTTFASGGASATQMRLTYFPNNGNSSGIFGTGILDILDYKSTTKNKTLRMFGGDDTNGAGYIATASGLWVNTSAITSVSMVHGDGDWLAGSTFALYGIKESA